MKDRIKNAKGFLFDIDGVFTQSGKPLPGATYTINTLLSKRIPFRFLTNTTIKSRRTLHKELLKLEINCKEDDIFSAGYSGVNVIRNLGSPSCTLFISEDLKRDYSRFQIDNDRPELVVIGDFEEWTFNSLNIAFNYVMGGAKIIALHIGKYYGTDAGLRLDAGAFVKALEYSTGEVALVVGKPSKNFFKNAIDDLDIEPKKIIMVGDDLVNDIGGAQSVNIPGLLVKTGKYHDSMLEASDIIPDGLIDTIGNIGKILNG